MTAALPKQLRGRPYGPLTSRLVSLDPGDTLVLGWEDGHSHAVTSYCKLSKHGLRRQVCYDPPRVEITRKAE